MNSEYVLKVALTGLALIGKSKIERQQHQDNFKIFPDSTELVMVLFFDMGKI